MYVIPGTHPEEEWEKYNNNIYKLSQCVVHNTCALESIIRIH